VRCLTVRMVMRARMSVCSMNLAAGAPAVFLGRTPCPPGAAAATARRPAGRPVDEAGGSLTLLRAPRGARTPGL
jgi:hypothetical protein